MGEGRGLESGRGGGWDGGRRELVAGEEAAQTGHWQPPRWKHPGKAAWPNRIVYNFVLGKIIFIIYFFQS